MLKLVESKIHYMKKAVSAGGVVVKNEGGQIKILLITFPQGGLSFPKGHVCEGESHEEAAIREVREETGLTDLHVIKKLGIVTRPSIERDGIKVLKDIHLYLLKSESYKHHGAEEVYGWYTIEEALSLIGPQQEVNFLKDNLEYLLLNVSGE